MSKGFPLGRWDAVLFTFCLAFLPGRELDARIPPVLFQDSLPTVVVLSTGGTIASTRASEEEGYRSSLPGQELVAAVPGLEKVALIEVQDVANVGSTNMTPELWLEVSRRANEALIREEVAGVLVTHGTDTMEETAYFLDLTVSGPKPVILVGAMRAASEWDADGVRFYRAPLRRQFIPVPEGVVLPTVDIVPNYAGADGRLIRGLLTQGTVDGLVVDAAGAGNMADPLFQAVKEARDQGVAVVITSRTHAGRVLPLYAGGGGGTTLEALGCVFADNLSAQKARVLLIAALPLTRDPEGLRRIFGH